MVVRSYRRTAPLPPDTDASDSPHEGTWQAQACLELHSHELWNGSFTHTQCHKHRAIEEGTQP